ncbi:MAG: TIGR04076 family protein [Candidatus Heimdallarchaeota archaeon]|nr:TIGR04076 family protein [Candidatus Heimdallarchaeota archaeon]
MHRPQGKYKVEVIVKSQKGSCYVGHKVGEKILYDGLSLKGEICASALNTLWPIIFSMHHGVIFPWSVKETGSEDMTCEACPDAENPVVFELRRLKEEPLLIKDDQ